MRRSGGTIPLRRWVVRCCVRVASCGNLSGGTIGEPLYNWRPLDRYTRPDAGSLGDIIRSFMTDTKGQNVPHSTAFGPCDEQPERFVPQPQDVRFSREDTQREYDQLTRREVNQWEFMRWCVQRGIVSEDA